MTAFPAYAPSELTLRLPNYPVIPGSWRAQEYPTIEGSLGVGATMRLRYRNVTDAVVLELLQVWRATGGGMAQLDPLPSQVASGIQDTDLANRILAVEPLAWAMAEPPRQESVKAGRSNVTVELVAELRVKVALGGLCAESPEPPTEDEDAAAYLNAVESADGQTLEAPVRAAIDDFVVGLKSDGLWASVQTCCILAGARTLNGALVPLKGAAPVNHNFVLADYDRELGLKGDGTTKYLDSARSNNADPQDDNHRAVYATSIHTDSLSTGCYVGVYESSSPVQATVIYSYAPPGGGGNIGDLRTRNNSSNLVATANLEVAGLLGSSRSSGTDYTVRGNSTSVTITEASLAPAGGKIFLFALNETVTPGIGVFCDARLAFYSLGTSIDLSQLDSRVTTLVSDLGAAIA